jgi:hypothetical protein
VKIDHVIYGVRDLDAAGRWLKEDVGLDSVEGGFHPAYGTGNRIVPLGDDCYLELMAIVDRHTAEKNFLGKKLLEHLSQGERFVGWVVATDELTSTAERLGLLPVPGSRVRPDKKEVTWKVAGIEEAFARDLPFFISWDEPAQHPSRMKVDHRLQPEGIAWIELGTDEVALKEWLGDLSLPLRFDGERTGVNALGIKTSSGEIVLS